VCACETAVLFNVALDFSAIKIFLAGNCLKLYTGHKNTIVCLREVSAYTCWQGVVSHLWEWTFYSLSFSVCSSSFSFEIRVGYHALKNKCDLIYSTTDRKTLHIRYQLINISAPTCHLLLLLLLLLDTELPLMVESFGLLSDLLPFPSILDAGCPVFNLHLANTLFNVILPSVCGSSLWSFG